MITLTIKLTDDDEQKFLQKIYQNQIKNEDTQKIIEKFVTYFLSNIDKEISNQELRKQLFISNNKFKKFMNDNLYLINEKLKKVNFEIVTYSEMRKKIYKVITLDD